MIAKFQKLQLPLSDFVELGFKSKAYTTARTPFKSFLAGAWAFFERVIHDFIAPYLMELQTEYLRFK